MTDKNDTKELKETYESCCNEYLQIFCDKQEMTNEGWVADEVGGIAFCSDFYFNFGDIVWDINTEQPKGRIIDWYYSVLDDTKNAVNYYTYTKLKQNEDNKQ